ncbi:MAG TPA: hypothetical protein VHG09_04585 [Longimicrobiales bacterium]|nr:hypothetical protein [Longimicrobiales bacterium]
MRAGVLFMSVLLIACGDDDATGPRPSERFAGLYTLVEEGGSTLPHTHITAEEDTIEHYLTTLTVNDDSYLPEAFLIDSLVRRDHSGGSLALVNETVRETLVGFIQGDTVWYHDNEEVEETRFRFFFDASGDPVRLTEDSELVDEVWTRQ